MVSIRDISGLEPDEICTICKEMCNSLAGNPGKWPLSFPDPEKPGVVKQHHVECVTRLLREGEAAKSQIAREVAAKFWAKTALEQANEDFRTTLIAVFEEHKANSQKVHELLFFDAVMAIIQNHKPTPQPAPTPEAEIIKRLVRMMRKLCKEINDFLNGEHYNQDTGKTDTYFSQPLDEAEKLLKDVDHG